MLQIKVCVTYNFVWNSFINKVNKFTYFSLIKSYWPKLHVIVSFKLLHSPFGNLTQRAWAGRSPGGSISTNRTSPPGALDCVGVCERLLADSFAFIGQQQRGSVWTGKRRGELWSNPPRPKQLQQGERGGGESQPAGAAVASQPRSQPAWASRLASLASPDYAASPLLLPGTPAL